MSTRSRCSYRGTLYCLSLAASASLPQWRTRDILSLGRCHLGVIAVADVLRTNSRATVHKLKQAGIVKLVMLTGDNARTAQAIARQTDVDEVRADLLPEDKVAVIQQLLQ